VSRAAASTGSMKISTVPPLEHVIGSGVIPARGWASGSGRQRDQARLAVGERGRRLALHCGRVQFPPSQPW